MQPMSRSARILTAAMVTAGFCLISACGLLDTPTPELTEQPLPPTAPENQIPDPSEDAPPPATLTIGDQSQVSGIGSYCWPGVSGEFALCADMIGIPTAQEPLEASESFLARFEFPLPDPPVVASLMIIPVTENDEMAETGQDFRFWPPKPGESIQLPLETMPEVELSLEPGLYVFSVFVRWEDVGDVLYGFLVEVGPDSTG